MRETSAGGNGPASPMPTSCRKSEHWLAQIQFSPRQFHALAKVHENHIDFSTGIAHLSSQGEKNVVPSLTFAISARPTRSIQLLQLCVHRPVVRSVAKRRQLGIKQADLPASLAPGSFKNA